MGASRSLNTETVAHCFSKGQGSQCTRHCALRDWLLRPHTLLPHKEDSAANLKTPCHEHVIHDGIHKFPQQIMRIPAAPVSHCVKPETKPPTQTNDSQFWFSPPNVVCLCTGHQIFDQSDCSLGTGSGPI